MKIHLSKGRIAALGLALILLLTVCGSTVAYLVTGTDPLTLLFSPATVDCKVVYTSSADMASDFRIQNTGTTQAYIRATVLVQWVKENEDGSVTVLAISPEKGSDYSIDYAPTEQEIDGSGNVTSVTRTKWRLHSDGYWYYTEPVAPNGKTMSLIGSFKRQNVTMDGYTIRVEVLAQAIQATPAEAVKDAWGLDPSTLT